ncbi:LptE family protein [Pedobacter sp. MW01-1-1]|uniref:LptE family protein n=1 Tax=Pedobacter sp. MW01-1-1 TaxID=3383027 RepID=UPI003FEFDFF6
MKLKVVAFICITFLCACSYKFSGASTDGLKTVAVRVFENNAPLVVPTLSNQVTESLKNRIRTQTRLIIAQGEADAVFDGRITGYEIKPVALQAGSTPTSGANRLTITVSVKYTNNVKGQEKSSFEQSFSRYYDFPLNGANIQSLLPAAIENINKQLSEDMFNAAFAQW